VEVAGRQEQKEEAVRNADRPQAVKSQVRSAGGNDLRRLLSDDVVGAGLCAVALVFAAAQLAFDADMRALLESEGVRSGRLCRKASRRNESQRALKIDGARAGAELLALD
jgi:hypothetical protein